MAKGLNVIHPSAPRQPRLPRGYRNQRVVSVANVAAACLARAAFGVRATRAPFCRPRRTKRSTPSGGDISGEAVAICVTLYSAAFHSERRANPIKHTAAGCCCIARNRAA